MPEDTLYELLQVQPTADPEIIQAAYRRMILRYHPDRNDGVDAEAMTQRLNRAYEVLSDPSKREAYDKEIAARAREGARRNPTETSSSSPTSQGTRPATPYSGRLPTWVWASGIGGALALAAFLIAVWVGASPNVLSWFTEDQEIVTATVSNDFQAEVTASNTTVTQTNQAGEQVEPTQEAASPSLTPTAIPTTAPSQPPLTERDIFVLDSAGEISPDVAALLLRLLHQGLSPTLDQHGAVTATAINAAMEDVCRYVDCVGGTIPSVNDVAITLIVMAEPINPNVDRNYVVWLADSGGVTLDSKQISWSTDQLERSPASESPPKVTPEVAPEEETGRVKSVSLTFPPFNLSVSDFIKDYNEVFLGGLEKYENEKIIECSLSFDSDGVLQIGNQECIGKTFPSFQMELDELTAVLGRHFTIGLMLESEFNDLGLGKNDRP